MNDLLSIIVPIYNVEQYLDECLQSLLQQTYTNFEVILVNDGSTDQSGSICKKYCLKDSRLKYYEKRNGGLSDARNYGIEKARGKYIAFVDSDDYVDKEMYQILIKNLIHYNSQIVCCPIKIKFANYTKIKKEIQGIKIFDSFGAIKDVLNQGGSLDYAAWNKVYMASLFSDIRFPKGKIYEDMHIMPIIFSKCKQIIQIDKPLYYYRQREKSITSSAFSKKNFDIISAYESILTFLYKYDDSLYQIALQEFLIAKFDLIYKYLISDINEYNLMINKIKKSISYFELWKIHDKKNFYKYLILKVTPLKLCKILVSRR